MTSSAPAPSSIATPVSDTLDTPSPQALRAALGMFATGVTIITTRDDSGQPRGLTASSFNSVSLTPPLVLWSLMRSSSSFAAFTQTEHFCVNVLSAEQLPLAQRFAMRGIDRWADVDWQPGAGGAPLLPGSAAAFECTRQTTHEAGDHVIFIGQVLRVTHRQDASPLLFHGGRFYTALPLANAPGDAR